MEKYYELQLRFVISSAEYCAPVWSNSQHMEKLNVRLSQAMWAISETPK